MSEYEATIVRTIITKIRIKARDVQDVRDTIANYGVIEAASDYPQCEPETMLAKITAVKRRKYTAPK